MFRIFLFIALLSFLSPIAKAQCFASSGNPVGGTANMGTMDKNTFRIASFYRFLYSDRYYEGDKRYTGEKGILKRAYYNYLGLLLGYGIIPQLTAEIETGGFINKTQVYKIDDIRLRGYGLSNLVVSLKPRLYFNSDKRFEISVALGANIPYTREMQEADGVTLPIDVQPSTGSFGLVSQLFIIKENSFKGMRFFLVNRIEKYFKNKQDYLFGTLYVTSFFFSKHFVFENKKLKDWTLILQLKNQIRERNFRAGNRVNASGSYLFYLVPQVNLSLHETWNLSLLFDIPFYQYYYDIQLANKFSFAFTLIKDFDFNNKKKRNNE